MKKNHTIEIRLSQEELDKLKKKAELMGLPVSAFIRMIALKSKIEVKSEM